MKYDNIAFLFLLTIVLLLASCKRQFNVKESESITNDTLNYFVQQMKDRTHSDSVSLTFSNLALQQIDKASYNTNIIEEILSYKMYFFVNLKKYDSAIYSAKKLLDLVVKKKDTVGIGKIYAGLGYYYYENYQRDSAYLFYNKAKEIHLILKDSISIGYDLNYIAMIQSDLGDFEESDQTGLETLKYINKDNVQLLTSVYNCLAVNSRRLNDFNEAIYWYNKSLSITTDTITKIRILQNKANALRDLKLFDESISISDSLSKINIEDDLLKARIIDNLAFTKWSKNKNTDVLADLEAAFSIRFVKNDFGGLNSSYAHLSDFFEERNPQLALNYANKMLSIATKLKSPHDQLEALQKIIKLDNSPKVKEHYALYIYISDSINNAEKSLKNKFAKLKYDSEKNRKDNLQLKIANSEKELELEKKKYTNIIGGLSSGSLVLMLLVFGYYRNQKYKQEKRAEVYKTETRIAKKIHDEVANNVVNIMNKFQYTNEPKEKLLDDLEKVYLMTRNISHQNKSIETGKEFEYSLKALLTSFNNETTTIILKNISIVKLEKISPNKQIEIYRILQELLVNMQKHSKATLVAISFKIDQNKYFINYSDNGIGIDLKNVSIKNGLQNMETRIKSINGLIIFESSLNKGFKAFISFKDYNDV